MKDTYSTTSKMIMELGEGTKGWIPSHANTLKQLGPAAHAQQVVLSDMLNR